MATIAQPPDAPISLWDRLGHNRNWLGFWFMLPAAAFLLLFLAYPLGLGMWLSFTDTRIGRDGVFVGFENFVWLNDDRSSGSRSSTPSSTRWSPASSSSRSASTWRSF